MFQFKTKLLPHHRNLYYTSFTSKLAIKGHFWSMRSNVTSPNQTSHPYWQNNFLSTFSLLVASQHGGVLLAEVIRKLMCT